MLHLILSKSKSLHIFETTLKKSYTKMNKSIYMHVFSSNKPCLCLIKREEEKKIRKEEGFNNDNEKSSHYKRSK